MHILLTGGAGYIGSHIAKIIASEKHTKITVVDNLSGGDFDSIAVLRKLFKPELFRFMCFDLNDQNQLADLFKTSRFDAVIHLAAHLQVAESVVNPLKYYMNNTLNSSVLINMCIKYGVKNFVFSSTAAVYGHPKTTPITENTLTSPINPYGMSKLMTENILKDVAKAHPDFKYVVLRYFNVAGADADGLLGECHTPETHLIPLAVRAALGLFDDFSLYGDDYDTPDGTCLRDYIHVNDLAQAHILAIDYLTQNKTSNTFNCGYAEGFSVKQVINSVKKISQTDFKVQILNRRVGDPTELVADNQKIKKLLSWKPFFNDLDLICKSAFNWEKVRRGIN